MPSELTFVQIQDEMRGEKFELSFIGEVLDVLRGRGHRDSAPREAVQEAIQTVQGRSSVPDYLPRKGTPHAEGIYSDLGTGRDTATPPASLELLH